MPIHADIPHQDVVFLDWVELTHSSTKAKDAGKLGISGVAAAIANVVCNAIGIRVHDYPITLDKLIDRMPV